MPRGDGTGPMAAGPMTGRAAGYCAGYGVPGFANRPAGFGLGMGWGPRRGGGRGRSARFWGYGPAYGVTPSAPVDPVQTQRLEKDALSRQVQTLEQQLHHMKQRLEELDRTEEQSE